MLDGKYCVDFVYSHSVCTKAILIISNEIIYTCEALVAFNWDVFTHELHLCCVLLFLEEACRNRKQISIMSIALDKLSRSGMAEKISCYWASCLLVALFELSIVLDSWNPNYLNITMWRTRTWNVLGCKHMLNQIWRTWTWLKFKSLLDNLQSSPST